MYDQDLVKFNGDPTDTGYQDLIKKILKEKITSDGIDEDQKPATFELLKNLSHKLGWGYGKFDPYINGNYAVFMNHGPWLQAAKDSYGPAKKYISMFDSSKIKTKPSIVNVDSGEDIHSLTNFSQTITDIDIPEPNKEYVPVSTRQKNSFVNTRDFAGSDFNMNYIENKNLEVFKYHEAWHKSVELIREGLLYTETPPDNNYLIPNPYSNSVFVVLFEPHTYTITGLITLFGVLPVNLPFKNLVGDRSGPKVSTYAMNYKFMDIQYAFYDDWDAFSTSMNTENTIAQLFAKFAKISSSASN